MRTEQTPFGMFSQVVWHFFLRHSFEFLITLFYYIMPRIVIEDELRIEHLKSFFHQMYFLKFILHTCIHGGGQVATVE